MEKLLISTIYEENKYLHLLNDVSLEKKYLNKIEISRPGSELFGFMDYYAPKRIQLYGLQETEVLHKGIIAEKVLQKILVPEIPLIIFSRNLTPPPMFLEIATQKGIPVFQTEYITSKVFSSIFNYVEEKLAPEIKVHGVMINIYGTGVLIKGTSGIGKSEVALELVRRGHYLVADDSVIIKKIDSERLVTTAPKLLQNKMEIRGIGIVDIQKLYGVTSVLKDSRLDLVIELTNSNKDIERVGVQERYEEILEVPKRKITIPILSGKNISNLIEAAVADNQLKKDYGYNASEEFVKNLNDMIKENGKNENN